MDPLAERLAEELRTSAGRRKRLTAVECDDAILEVAPQLRSDPGRRRRVLQLLAELADAGHIAWSASRDRSVAPELPSFVTLSEEHGQARPAFVAAPSLPWRPELEWAYALRLTPSEHEVLVAIQIYRRDREQGTAPAPHRERSLQLFGDEKRIDRLVRGRLFEPGRLSLDLLDAYWAPPPIAFTDTGGTGPVLVSENAASWHTLVKALNGRARAVAYGAGGAFAQSVAGLAEIDGVTAIAYIGDLDAEGVAIPQRAAAAAAAAGLPTPIPHVGLWEALVQAATRCGQQAIPVPGEVATELCEWFTDAALAQEVGRLLETGTRVPQEALNEDVITKVVATNCVGDAMARVPRESAS